MRHWEFKTVDITAGHIVRVDWDEEFPNTTYGMKIDAWDPAGEVRSRQFPELDSVPDRTGVTLKSDINCQLKIIAGCN